MHINKGVRELYGDVDELASGDSKAAKMVSPSFFLPLVSLPLLSKAWQPITRATSCGSLTLPPQPNVSVVSIQVAQQSNIFVPSNISNIAAALNFCEVNVTLNHPGEDDSVLLRVWLPLTGWNGRFAATGGGGLSSGPNTGQMADALAAGYATAGTDAGLSLSGTIDSGGAAWVLSPNGTRNDVLLENYSHRSGHDMAVVGKAVVEAYYGTPAHHSYWSGCSTGGRQAYVSAVRYPNDFDGILAIAPAHHFGQLAMTIFWPSVVMYQEKNIPPQCVFSFFLKSIISGCDGLDGIEDGIITNPAECAFDPYKLVGTSIPCDDVQKTVTITAADAKVVQMILYGPINTSGVKRYYGLTLGSPFNGVANTTRLANGSIIPKPGAASDIFVKYFLAKDPNYDVTAITYAEYDKLFDQALEEYDSINIPHNQDMSAFRDAGGKLLTWQGSSDQLAYYEAGVDYWNQIQRNMTAAGAPDIHSWNRLFLAPGVIHCHGGIGPEPRNALNTLAAWVEEGKAPDTLMGKASAAAGGSERNLCPYPKALRYDGKGNPNISSSYFCAHPADVVSGAENLAGTYYP